jgi:hypothetical protein
VAFRYGFLSILELTDERRTKMRAARRFPLSKWRITAAAALAVYLMSAGVSEAGGRGGHGGYSGHGGYGGHGYGQGGNFGSNGMYSPYRHHHSGNGGYVEYGLPWAFWGNDWSPSYLYPGFPYGYSDIGYGYHGFMADFGLFVP